jgi:NitT/TauT family transport system permease protein
LLVTPGLDPGVHLFRKKMDGRVISAFTRVFNALCPAMTRRGRLSEVDPTVSRPKLLALQLLVALAAVLLWQLFTSVPIGGVKLLPPFFFSTPADVAARIVKWFVEGTIWKHLWITLVESVLAFVIGSIAGVLIGFWFAQQPRVAAVFDPYVKMINALPRVVLAPIFALWLGLGIWSKVALGVTLVFFIVFFNVYQGVKEVSPTVLANARMLGMSERALMRHVYWPSALSWMFSSLHTAVGFAVVGAVVGEYLGSAAGLGYIIQQAEGVFDVAGVFAGMLVLAAFVIGIDFLVTLVERRLLVWRPVAAETRT